MAETYYFISNNILHEAYDRRDIQKSIQQCESVIIELMQIGGYIRPMIKLVQNCLGVLHYCSAIQEKSDGEVRKKEKETALRYLELSKDAEYFHAPLRMVTCLMFDKTNNELVEQMLKTANAAFQMMLPICELGYKEFAELCLNQCMQALLDIKERKDVNALMKLHEIVKADILNRDAEQTITTLKEMLPESEGFYHAMTGPWKDGIWLEIIFMATEIDILPYPLQLEAKLQIFGKSLQAYDMTDLRVSFLKSPKAVFHPYIYSTFMAFVFYLNNGMDWMKCCYYLRLLEKAIPDVAEKYRVVGYNLLTYGNVKKYSYKAATQNLMSSLKLQPDQENIAFHYLIKVCNELKSSQAVITTDSHDCETQISDEDQLPSVRIIYERCPS